MIHEQNLERHKETKFYCTYSNQWRVGHTAPWKLIGLPSGKIILSHCCPFLVNLLPKTLVALGSLVALNPLFSPLNHWKKCLLYISVSLLPHSDDGVLVLAFISFFSSPNLVKLPAFISLFT